MVQVNKSIILRKLLEEYCLPQIKYQPNVSSNTLAQQSSFNRMFRPDLGATINYLPYVSSRHWHNNQLSTVCFVQTLAQQSTMNRMFRPRHWYNNQLSAVYFVVQDLGTTINYQPFVSSRPWYNNQLSTICFVHILAQQSTISRNFRSRPWYRNQLSTVCFVQTLAQQSTINGMFRPDLGTTINYQP